MRTFKQRVQIASGHRGIFGGIVLPVHRRLAIFARQSTVRQTEINIDSKEYQTEDLIDIAVRVWGWLSGDIDIIDLDLGVSGRKRIHQRPGMKTLYERIKAGKYGAVAVSEVDRLFRDKIGVQSGLFIEACIEQNVLILTPDKVYDLRNWKDLRDFREKLGEAADYDEEIIIGRLLARRERASMRGRYDGRAVAVGFIVDRTDRKNKRYIVYDEHAKVVRWLFKRFRELGGSLSTLLRELAKLPYVFPEFEAGMKPEKIRVERRGAGYGLSRDGLISILTNPAYIGTWILRNKDGEVIANIPNNHPAILKEPEDVDNFYYAFRLLSREDVDGTPFRPVKRPMRHEKPHDEPLASDFSLLTEVITSMDGPIYPVTTKTPKTKKTVFSYAIADVDPDTKQQGYKTYIDMGRLDRLFAERLVYVVALWTNSEEAGQSMYDALKAEREAEEQVLMDIDEQLAGYYKTIANIDAFIQAAGSVTDATTLQKYGIQLAEARANVAELERQRKEASTLDADVEECADLLDCARTNFYGMPLNKQRRFIRLVIREIAVSVPAPHFIKMRIKWRRPYMVDEVGLIFKRGGSSPLWTDDENTLIRKLYPRADRETILRSLPTRSWNSIKLQAQGLGIERMNLASRYPLHPSLSISDEEFMQKTRYTNPHEQPVQWGTVNFNELTSSTR